VKEHYQGMPNPHRTTAAATRAQAKRARWSHPKRNFHRERQNDNEDWQGLEVRQETSGTISAFPREQFVWHPYYIDALATRFYDSEGAHVYARDELGIRSIIPSQAGRPTIRPPTGRWRRVMAQRFDHQTYGQRWQVETVASMLKRNLGSALRARTYCSQCREMLLRALTHNIMTLLPCWRLFYGARMPPLFLCQFTQENTGITR
jgi:hypothetical protein